MVAFNSQRTAQSAIASSTIDVEDALAVVFREEAAGGRQGGEVGQWR